MECWRSVTINEHQDPTKYHMGFGKIYTDYVTCRVIAFMQTFCQITKGIINKRLIAIVYKTGLYRIN